MLDDVYWPTVEHYFQAQKFAGSDYAERIRASRTPKEAKNLGMTRKHVLRADWEEVKVKKADILCGRGLAFKNMGKLRESLADYDRAVQEDPNSVTAFNRRAWLRATASDKSVQDSKRAIEDAKRAMELAGQSDANLLSTLAAAYALDDNFTAAITSQREAIQLDPENTSLQEMLNAFEAGRPWIESPDQ